MVAAAAIAAAGLCAGVAQAQPASARFQVANGTIHPKGHTGICLAIITQGSHQPEVGDKVMLKTCNSDNPFQHWSMTKNGSVWTTFRTGGTSMCLVAKPTTSNTEQASIDHCVDNNRARLVIRQNKDRTWDISPPGMSGYHLATPDGLALNAPRLVFWVKRSAKGYITSWRLPPFHNAA